MCKRNKTVLSTIGIQRTDVRFIALYVVQNLGPAEMLSMENMDPKDKIYEDSVRTLSYLFSLDIEPFLMVF